MTDIVIRDLVKSFEVGETLLNGVSLEITAGERVGLLGRNGCGKTTLFRILTGEIHEDAGQVHIAPGRRLGLISQIPVYPEHYTTEDVLKTAHAPIYALQDKLTKLAEDMAHSPSPALLAEYDRCTAELEARDGYHIDHNRNRVANGLRIPEEMRRRPFALLSGGEKTRVNLARLILEDTDILLLDEPTNHLDLKATQWLEEYLLRFKGTVLAISHDRWFLDHVVQRCIEIEDGKAQFYSGNYSFYVEEKQRRYEEQLRRYERDQAKLAQLQAAADKLHLWAFMGNDKLHKRAFSMEKRMEKLSTTERPKKARVMQQRFGTQEFFGDEVLVIEHLKKAFGEKLLFEDLNLEMTGGERVALIGDNGTGKSTLLKLILQQELPDAGFLYQGPAVKTGYLPQIVEFDDPNRNLIDTLLYGIKCTPQQARDQLARFYFRGEDVLKPVSALSGGERSRLKLCMLMANPINLLILDEPTNHLDIASREWIEASLADYTEALLFVSHDRFFIQRFATRIWYLENGTVLDFRGDYDAFLAYQARQAQLAAAQAPATPDKPKASKSKKEKGGASPAKRIAKLEREIEKLEAALAQKENEANENASDYKKLMEIQQEQDALNEKLAALYAEWETLSEAL